MADLKISELPPLAGGGLAEADVLPLTDTSASTSKRITAKDLIQYGVTLIDADSIPSDKIDLVLPADSVDTVNLVDGSVTAIKLADNSSGVVGSSLPVSGERIGQIAVDTTVNKLYVWEGSSWAEVQAAGSVNAVTGDTTGLILVAATKTGDTVNILASHANTTASRQFLAGPTAGPGVVEQRQIVGQDLPFATNAVQGAVVVGGGLTVDGTGNVSIDNAVTAQGARSLVEYNEYGLVVDGGPIQPSDLPSATNELPGVVIPGDSLSVDSSTNQLDIKNRITGGTFTKVTCDIYGSVTAGQQLSSDDLPSINGSKITSGVDGAVINDRSITEIKLSDYSTCLIQEGVPTGDFKLGQFWFTPSTNQLRVFGRGSDPNNGLWLSIGFGALQQQNLRWGGTCDASTSTVTTLTDIGISEGLTAGDPLPNPSDALSGLYFVVDTAGDAITIPNVNGDTCTEGDWILYVDMAQGAIHLDVSAGGGGGGGGAKKLGELTDVTLSGEADGDFLTYNSISGGWQNTRIIDCGTF